MKFLCYLAFLASAPLFGATIVSDSFDDGGRTDGADALDVSWNKTTTGSSLSVINDDTVFSGNVLKFTPSVVLNAVTATMPTVTLGVGQSLVLSFAFRYTTTPTANLAGALRMGLYNNNGGETLADTATVTTDGSGWKADGYYAALRSGPGAAPSGTDKHEMFRETVDDNAILAGTRSTLTGANAGVTTPGISDTAIHNISFEIVRTGTSAYTLRALVDGVVLANGSDTTAGISTFNTIAISTGGVNVPWVIDDVNVVYTVPEPATAMLGLLGAAFCFRRRR